MIRIITLFQIDQATPSSEEIVVLLKGRHEEILGGISIDVHSTTAYISRFWLKPQIRGYSFGSILLQEAISQLKKYPAINLRMGTHIYYIKNILLNNRFDRYEAFTHQQTTYDFYQLNVQDAKMFNFTHPYHLISNPDQDDCHLFFTLYEKGAINLYNVLKPLYIQVSNHDERLGTVASFYGQKKLFIDHLSLSKDTIRHQQLTNALIQYGKTLSIDTLHYLNGTNGQLDDKENVSYLQTLQFA